MKMESYKVLYWNKNERFVRENINSYIVEANSVQEVRQQASSDIIVERVVKVTEADLAYEKRKLERKEVEMEEEHE